jgi:hypothetical protein|tara:strand:+ start:32 stop:874 length:843 start_codon:yes stop_codon:yes gene_type:complete
MKKLTIVTTYGTKYWPLPVQKGLKTIEQFWPEHAEVLVYPDDMSQQMPLRNTKYYDLCKEQPKLQEFIDRHKDNPKFNPRIKQNDKEKKDFDKNTQIYIYDAVRFSYKVFACIDAWQKTKPDMLWFLDADIVTFEKITTDWLTHITPDDKFTSYLGRPKKGFSETGYYAFNTAHKHAGEFFERWQTYYDKDRFLELKGYTDSFTFDGARLELEKEGKIQNEDLNDGRWAGDRRSRHPFINSELGQYMDHLKGYERKAAMTSKKRDLTTKQSHPYWKTLKD